MDSVVELPFPKESDSFPATAGPSGAVTGVTRSFTIVAMHAVRTAVAGTVAGIAEETASYPLDLVKTRMQVHSESVSAIQVLRHTLKTDGVVGLFRGLPGPLMASAVVSGSVFGGYGYAVNTISPTPSRPTTPHIVMAGGFAGLLQSFIICPVDVVKNKMQIGHHASTSEAISQIWKTRGVRGFYTAFGATLLRDVPAYAAFFTTYELLKKLGANPDEGQNFLTVVFAGGIAGMVYHSSTYPIDVAKTRLQTQSDIEPKYKGLWDCMKDLYRSKSLFRGFWPTALRSFPSYGAGFVVYELTLKLTSAQ